MTSIYIVGQRKILTHLSNEKRLILTAVSLDSRHFLKFRNLVGIVLLQKACAISLQARELLFYLIFLFWLGLVKFFGFITS